MPEQGDLFETSFAREVIDTPVSSEMSESFLAYSLSVITSRAIPDVRDGLKPVQRRILFSMAGLGMRPDRPHRKCAGVVGDTMGRYHPHGDGAIYDALTRMGQDFSRNISLVDPHGNFGTLDDPPAAYRYTECRLSPAAMSMLAEIDEDTVEFRPTFDGERDEPVYLPAALPNLLVNGTTGIAVGMATNMPPHNVAEVAAAIRLVMTQRRPKPTVGQLMELLPGPDLPGGATIIDDNLAEAYETGRGSFRIRATAEIVKLTRSRQGIVVTELPYMVGPERVVAKITELVNSGKLVGVADVKNLSDRRTGLNLTIGCKPGVNAAGVLTELYRLTPMEESYGVNNVVLVDGIPTTVGLHDLCRLYGEHRLEVVRRRTEFRLARARDRLHIIEGLLIALDAIDEVIEIIRSSEDAATARQRLMEHLDLSEIQATHILDMQLRRLTALEHQKLTDEADALRTEIADYEKILASDQRRRTIVLKELDELVEEFGRERRTRIISPDEIDDVSLEAMIEDEGATDEACRIALSTTGMIGRAPEGGAKQATMGRHDVLVEEIVTTTGSPLVAITDAGRALHATVGSAPEITGRSRGVAASELFATQRGEQVLRLVARPPGTERLDGDTSWDETTLMLVTMNGLAKQITLAEVLATPTGKTVIGLKPGDRVVAAFPTSGVTQMAMLTSNAQCLRTEVSGVSVQGRGAKGVAGIKLSGDATVVAAGPADDGAVVLTHSDAQTAKVTDVSEIATKGRGTGGVRVTKFRTEKRLDFGYIGPEEGLHLTVGSEDAPSKPDARPEPLSIPHTGRDLASKKVPRRILAAGPGRW